MMITNLSPIVNIYKTIKNNRHLIRKEPSEDVFPDFMQSDAVSFQLVLTELGKTRKIKIYRNNESFGRAVLRHL